MLYDYFTGDQILANDSRQGFLRQVPSNTRKSIEQETPRRISDRWLHDNGPIGQAIRVGRIGFLLEAIGNVKKSRLTR